MEKEKQDSPTLSPLSSKHDVTDEQLDNPTYYHKFPQQEFNLNDTPPSFSFNFVPRSTNANFTAAPFRRNLVHKSTSTRPANFNNNQTAAAASAAGISERVFQKPFNPTMTRLPIFNANYRPNEPVTTSSRMIHTTNSPPLELDPPEEIDVINPMNNYSSSLEDNGETSDIQKPQPPQVNSALNMESIESEVLYDSSTINAIQDNQEQVTLVPPIATSNFDEYTEPENNNDHQPPPVDFVTCITGFTQSLEHCTQSMQQCDKYIKDQLCTKETDNQQNRSTDFVEVKKMMESNRKTIGTLFGICKKIVKQQAMYAGLHQSRARLKLEFINAIEPDLKWMVAYAKETKSDSQVLKNRLQNLDLEQQVNGNRLEDCVNKRTNTHQDNVSIDHSTPSNRQFTSHCQSLKHQLEISYYSFKDICSTYMEQENAVNESTDPQKNVIREAKERLDKARFTLSQLAATNENQQQEIAQLKSAIQQGADVLSVMFDSPVHSLLRQSSTLTAESDRMVRELEGEKKKIKIIEKRIKSLEAKVQNSNDQQSSIEARVLGQSTSINSEKTSKHPTKANSTQPTSQRKQRNQRKLRSQTQLEENGTRNHIL